MNNKSSKKYSLLLIDFWLLLNFNNDRGKSPGSMSRNLGIQEPMKNFSWEHCRKGDDDSIPEQHQ